MYTGLHMKYPLFLPDLSELEYSRAIFEKCSKLKFHKNPSSQSLLYADGQTDIAKLTVVFRNFANAPTTKAFTQQPRRPRIEF